MKNKKKRIVAVSGGFDPLHIGHIRLFQEAKQLGDKLLVILNNDHWLIAKKGFVFMPQEERKEVIEAISVVDSVMLTKHDLSRQDMSVCPELEEFRPDIFVNGGDRSKENIPEVNTCLKLGCKMVFNIGKGGKAQSSSWLLEKFLTRHYPDEIEIKEAPKIQRPWGGYSTIKQTQHYWVKKLFVNKNSRLSLQCHQFRDEVWVVASGSVLAEIGNKTYKVNSGESVFIPRKIKHRLTGLTNACVLEMAFGSVMESDIMRYEDDYSRVLSTIL